MHLSPPPSVEVMTVVASPSTDDVVVVEALVRSVKAVQALPIQAEFEGSRTASREAADKGKAPMLPRFTAIYGPDMPSDESTIAIGMHFKATNQALQDRQLVGELAKMVILPADWKVSKARPVLEIQSDAYMSLIGVSAQTFFIQPFSSLAE